MLTSGQYGFLQPGLQSGLSAQAKLDGPASAVFPASNDDLAAVGELPMGSMWLCQDTSGGAVDSVGSVGLSAAGAGVHLYRQAIGGYTTLALGSTADGDVCNWRASAGSGPNPATDSVFWWGYTYLPSKPAVTRSFIMAAPTLLVNLQTDGTLQLGCGGNLTAGSVDHTGTPFAWALSYNSTKQTVSLHTALEPIVGTYSVVADGNKGIGHVSGVATCVYRFLRLGACGGKPAERNPYTFLQHLGVPLAY